MRFRLMGAAMVVMGAVIAAYSYPFVTFVAFGFFLAGLTLIGTGVTLAAKGEPGAR